jgi:cytochrome c-type biogenesis protein CcmF
MNAQIGHAALVLALSLSCLLGLMPLWGAARGLTSWMALARPLAIGVCLLVGLSFGCLVIAFIDKDFSLAYVARNANSLLPLQYRIAASWGGHEGSLLLWQLMLNAWAMAVALFGRDMDAPLRARVLGVLGLISAGFLSFMLITSNPFQAISPVPADGADLNPLLQDVGMIFHPPLLYMGYVGFSVAFAFAIAALLSGQPDPLWARRARPWTLAAWSFLTLGILLGSFWAYYELGWGGWWFWDPVENASFMPWLVGTALLHSLVVTEKRQGFRSWTVLLAILAFSLALLGTFLVRSGVLTSVHAFASDPARGRFILVMLSLVIGGSLALYAWRAPKWASGPAFGWLSREASLMLNNLFLVVAAGTVLLGTLYPLAVDALDLGRISVGPPYFESVFVPLMMPLLLALPIGPWLAWRRAEPMKAWQMLRWSALAAVLLGAGLYLSRIGSPMMAAGVALGAWILLATLRHVVSRAKGSLGWLAGLRQQPPAYWGMVVAHAGIGVFVLGVTLLKGLEHSQDHSLRVGESVELGGYRFAMQSVQELDGPNYIAARARFEITRDAQVVSVLHPERRIYTVQRMPMTEAAIDRGVLRDLYVSLGGTTDEGRWGVRVQVKPFMGWVWAGCLLMAGGGLIAAFDRRRRTARAKAGAPEGLAPDAAPQPAATASTTTPKPASA